MHDGLHIFTAGLIGGIHVGNKAKPGRNFMARGGRQRAVHITVVVQQHILQAQRPHFLLEIFGQRKLALSAWVGVGLLAGGGVKFDILQKAFVCSHKMHPPDGVLLSVYHSLQHFSKASCGKGAAADFGIPVDFSLFPRNLLVFCYFCDTI